MKLIKLEELYINPDKIVAIESCNEGLYNSMISVTGVHGDKDDMYLARFYTTYTVEELYEILTESK